MANDLSRLIKYIHRTDWRDIFEEVKDEHWSFPCENLGVDIDDIEDILGDGHFLNLWGCALEDLMSRDFEDGDNVVDEYLKRRGYAESGQAKRYMQALRHSVMSLYEVSDIVPGKSFLARDLIRGGEPVRVTEKSGSRTLKPWDRIAARVVRLGSEWRMGGGCLVFTRMDTGPIIELFRAADYSRPANKSSVTAPACGPAELEERMRLAAMLLVNAWLADALQPKLPKLVNTSGHSLVLCTSRFALLDGTGPEHCRTTLAAIPSLFETSDDAFDWLQVEPEAPRVRSDQPGESMTIVARTGTGEAILGSIEIETGALVLSTNSRERAERGEAMIASALGGRVGAPSREEISGDEVLARKAKGEASAEPAERADISPEEERAIVGDYLDSQYRRILDEPIPMLGNRSPRAAALDPEGRAKVVAWLKHMENGSITRGGGPMADYDFLWMWRELGVSDLRV